jgi:hypothetical protein
VSKQNRLFLTILALWAASIGAAVAYLVLARETEHRWRNPADHTAGRDVTRVFDWTALGIWAGVISAAAVLAVVLTAVWTEPSE